MIDDVAMAARGILRDLPPREPDMEVEMTAVSRTLSTQRSEAERDAICAVLLAIRRRGDDPMSGWKTKDIEAVHAIAQTLVDLGRK